MGRSLKKGPHVDERLLEKVYRADNPGNRDPIKTWSRACTIVPEFVGKNFSIHNGRNFIKLYVTEDMVGHKLREVAPPPTLRRPGRRAAATAAPPHAGRTFTKLSVTEDMVGHKLGEFAPTRTFRGHGGKSTKG